jgi:hypothetical protein
MPKLFPDSALSLLSTQYHIYSWMFHRTEARMPYLLYCALGRLPPARASLLAGVFLVPRPPVLPAQRPQLDRVVKRAAHKLHAQAQKPQLKEKKTEVTNKEYQKLRVEKLNTQVCRNKLHLR